MTAGTTTRREPAGADATCGVVGAPADGRGASADAVRRAGSGRWTRAVDAGVAGRAARVTSGGHGETLDRLVVSSWERLVSHAEAPCLLCGGTMEPRYGAHAATIGGRCRDCGTTLS